LHFFEYYVSILNSLTNQYVSLNRQEGGQMVAGANRLKLGQFFPMAYRKLEKIQRTGWVKRGVKNPETVLEHTYALLDFARNNFFNLGLSDEEYERLMLLLEIHDLAEARVGDIVTATIKNTDQQKGAIFEKAQKEKEAIKQIVNQESRQWSGNMPFSSEQVFGLWFEFEDGTGEIALLARQIDKYQPIERALHYEFEQGIPLFEEFRDHASKIITNVFLQSKIVDLTSKHLRFLSIKNLGGDMDSHKDVLRRSNLTAEDIRKQCLEDGFFPGQADPSKVFTCNNCPVRGIHHHCRVCVVQKSYLQAP